MSEHGHPSGMIAIQGGCRVNTIDFSQTIDPSSESISKRADLWTGQHSWLHPVNVHPLVDLVDLAPNKLEAE